MDEFKEEYAKKLSLQNDQMEELKAAFSVCQQKVEKFKEKLNGMEGIEEAKQQQKMASASAASMPTKSSTDLTIYSQRTSNISDCLKKLNTMKRIKEEKEKQQELASAAASKQANSPIDSTISDKQVL
jgi:phage shock protein A